MLKDFITVQPQNAYYLSVTYSFSQNLFKTLEYSKHGYKYIHTYLIFFNLIFCLWPTYSCKRQIDITLNKTLNLPFYFISSYLTSWFCSSRLLVDQFCVDWPSRSWFDGVIIVELLWSAGRLPKGRFCRWESNIKKSIINNPVNVIFIM